MTLSSWLFCKRQTHEHDLWGGECQKWPRVFFIRLSRKNVITKRRNIFLIQVDVDLIEHIIESDELNDKYLDVFHNQYIQDTIVKSVSINITHRMKWFVQICILKQKDEIKILENDVRTKEKVLEDNSLKLEDLEKDMVQIDLSQENLIIQRTELEYEAIKMKKQS